VSLGIIDEEDNNDTHAEKREKKPDFRFLTRTNGSCTKFVEGSSQEKRSTLLKILMFLPFS